MEPDHLEIPIARYIDTLNEEERIVRNNIIAAKQELKDIIEEIEKYKTSKQLPATEKNCKEHIKDFISLHQPPIFTASGEIITVPLGHQMGDSGETSDNSL